MKSRRRFSRRNNLAPKPVGPLIYDGAPKSLRIAFLGLLEGELNFSPSNLRQVVCRELKIEANPRNWSDYPNIWDEVQADVFRCEWYKFFDIVEAFASCIERRNNKTVFEDALNDLFEEDNIGWYLRDGLVELRGDEPLETLLEHCFDAVDEQELEVAASELSEAWTAISRRPSPDVSGAIFHAMASLEAVARHWADAPKLTLGELIKKHSSMFPRPLDESVAKLWGYSSEHARHGREGRVLSIDEALLAVGVSATLSTYLIRKLNSDGK